MCRLNDARSIGPNVRAFLDMLAWSEGTSRIAASDDGYNVLVGGALFSSYQDHPRQLIPIPRYNLKSSAAGRYQLLSRYFDHYRLLLGLTDFSPISQDLIAIQQIREQRALTPLRDGDVVSAIHHCANIWASLPGAGYGQHEQKLERLVEVYRTAGGEVR